MVAVTAGLVTNLYLFAQLAILDEWVFYGQLPSQCQCNKSLEIVTLPAKIYDSTNAESDVEPMPKPDVVTVTVTRWGIAAVMALTTTTTTAIAVAIATVIHEFRRGSQRRVWWQ